MKLISTNPSKNYEKLGEVDVSTPEEVVAKVAAARYAQPTWHDMGGAERVALLRKVGTRISERAEEIAQLTAQEMGMPIQEARDNAASALEYWNSYLDKAEEFLQPITTFEDAHELHRVYHLPRGVVVCIVPWNFPLSNFVWACGQNLVVGNTIVFKHSEETPLVGKFIEDIVDAELPPGVFSEVYGDAGVGRLLVEQKVDFICLTGSAAAGKQVGHSAGARLIPVSLELGGSAPGIVFEDADINAVAETIYMNRFMNNGQICDGLKRLIVDSGRFDEIVAKLLSIIKTKKLGDASDEYTDLGPLVAKRQLELLESQVQDAVAKGAVTICGGKRPVGLEGAFYEPTLVTNITADMRIWREEVFGPVLPIVRFETEAEAIQLANDTEYGLGGYIFTADAERFKRVALKVETCMITQNNLSYVRPENFFGGCKGSGHGREHGEFGFAEVTQTKLVVSEKSSR